MTGGASAAPLPVTLEQIDLGWLNTALRTRAPDATLLGFEILEVVRGTCTKVRMRLDVDDAARRAGIAERVILKGGFEPHSRAMSYMHQAEVCGYRDVLPALKLPSPACYFAEFDAERAQGLIILEDLSARDVVFCDPLKPQSPQAVHRRLAELARFHARTWGTAKMGPGGRWAGLPAISEANHLEHFLQPEIWRGFVNLPRGRAASVYFHDPAWMAEALRRLGRLADRLPQVVVHGDTHLGNLYVEADGTPGFFDSLPHRWAGIGEVAYHIGCALDPRDRREHERDLVQSYLAELARHGVSPPALDAATRQYAAFLAFGFCIFLVNEAEWQPEAINTAYTARFSAAMLDNDTLGALAEI